MSVPRKGREPLFSSSIIWVYIINGRYSVADSVLGILTNLKGREMEYRNACNVKKASQYLERIHLEWDHHCAW